MAGYFALARLSLVAGGVDAVTPVIWLPGGFALVALLTLGRSLWPSVFFGALLAYSEATGQVALSATIAAGHVAEAYVGAALVDRVAGGALVFRRADTVFRFLAIVTLASTPGAAAVGAITRIVGGLAAWSDLTLLWVTCWLGQMAGIFVLSPVLALWSIGPFDRARWLKVAEGAVVLACLAAMGGVVFGGRLPAGIRDAPLEFLCVPLLLWGAVRSGRRETALAILLLSVVAVWGTLQGFGPFARENRGESVLLVQAYVSVMAITGVVLAAAIAEHREAEAQLRELATTDPLTGLANYRRLIEVLRAEIARSNRTRRPFAVLFLDMNGLKRINDRYGHLVGSRALTRVADTLRTSTRTIDTPARFGGDEFAVVLPETAADGGQIVLRRICDRLASDTDKPVLSVSGGVAVCPRDGDSPTLLLRAADKLLYEAKSRSAAERRAAAKADTEKTGTLF
jgi:diguanylate cyclase (GGDEF)-like protein